MKKGAVLKIIGIILIVLQIISLIVNAKIGVKLFSTFSLYKFAYLLGYFLAGIIGLILIVCGCIVARRRADTIVKEIELTEEEKKKDKQKQNKNDLAKYLLIASIILLFAINILLLIILSTRDSNANRENVSSSSTSELDLETHNSSQNMVIDKNTLDNWGEFSSVHKLRIKWSRNLENPKYVLVSIEGLIVRGDNNQDLYIVDEPEYQGVRWRYAKKNQLALELLEDASDFMIISMKDDTKNRVITGDYIKLSGVLDTENLSIIDAEYKMIKAYE